MKICTHVTHALIQFHDKTTMEEEHCETCRKSINRYESFIAVVQAKTKCALSRVATMPPMRVSRI